MQEEWNKRLALAHTLEREREARRLVTRDAKALYEDERRYDPASGKMMVESVLRFPDPREEGPVQVYAMPFFVGMHRQQVVRFRAIEHVYEVEAYGGVTALRWFAWEPDGGAAALEARTTTFHRSISKLCEAMAKLRKVNRASSFTDDPTSAIAFEVLPPGNELDVTMRAIQGVIDDLNRVMGRYSPEAGRRHEQEERRPW
jgi:hypothetical protein